MADKSDNMNDGCESDSHGLSPQDKAHLETLNGKLQLVRDYTGSVASGRTTGFYLFGSGGAGKSHTVFEELERRKVPYRLYNSRMTGRGIYNALEDSPDAIHVLEDMEQLLRESGAVGVLRSALWAQSQKDRDGPMERLVTWSTYRREHEFVFTGGVIMTANRPFPDQPELDAIRTRIAYMQLVVSDNELKAQMRHIANQGFRQGREQIAPVDCRAVCEFVIDECMGLNRPLDLRLLINGFRDFLQWQDCDSGCHWRDMVSARVKRRPTRLEEVQSAGGRAAQKQMELQIAAQISEQTNDRAERRQLWFEQTGKSEQTLYRRLQEIRDNGFEN